MPVKALNVRLTTKPFKLPKILLHLSHLRHTASLLLQVPCENRTDPLTLSSDCSLLRDVIKT